VLFTHSSVNSIRTFDRGRSVAAADFDKLEAFAYREIGPAELFE
jgi:hypothetical protein